MQNINFLQIDERGRMTHPRRLMSLKNFILGFAAALGLTTANAAEIPSGPLTLEQCIQLALENNLNLRISNYTPRLSALSLQRVYSGYDPRFTFGTTAGNRVSKGRQNPLQFEIPKSETDSFDHNYSLNGILPTNTRYGINLRGNESVGLRDTGPFGSYGSSASIRLTQPLLRDAWSGDSIRMNIKLQKLQINNSSLTVLLQIMRTVLSVEEAYYGLIASRENVKVAEETLALTEKNFSNQERRAEVGTLAKSQLPQLEAEVLSQQASLLSVRNSYADSINNLKRLLTDDFAAAQDIDILPVGELNPVQTVFSRNDSWDKALNQHPDILQSKIALESADIDLKYSKNQLYPQLDLTAMYALTGNDNALLSYRHPDGTTGRYPLYESKPRIDEKNGGRLVQTYLKEDGEIYYAPAPDARGERLSTPFVGRDANFSRAFRDIRGMDYPYYSVGVTLSIPIPNRSARANYKASQLQNERAVLQHKELEQTILVNIDGLIRDAEYRFEQITVTRQARLSSELALENDTKRYNEGAIENYQVLQAQRDLTNRRYAEINAKVQYLTALSRLALAEGSTLDNNNINVDFEEE